MEESTFHAKTRRHAPAENLTGSSKSGLRTGSRFFTIVKSMLRRVATGDALRHPHAFHGSAAQSEFLEVSADAKANGRTRRCSRLGAPVPDQKDAPEFLPARCVPSRVDQGSRRDALWEEPRTGRAAVRLQVAMTAGCAALLPRYCNEMWGACQPAFRVREGAGKRLWHNARL